MKRLPHIIRDQFSSRNRRNTLTFLVFLGISTLFWFVMTLNDEVQKDLTLKVEIQGLPGDMTLLMPTGSQPVVNVSVRDKGGAFIYQRLSHNNTLKVNYHDFNAIAGNRLTLSQSQLAASIRQFFGPTATFSVIKPDSLSIAYTTLPPLTVAVEAVVDVHTRPQYIVCSQAKCNVDSIKLYTSDASLSIAKLYTEPLQATEVSDTITKWVNVLVPAGCRAVPSRIQVTVPVEPLVTKTFSIPVETINRPADTEIVTFPATVDFTCLLPMSRFNEPAYSIKAYADYDKREGNIIPLEMSLLPDIYLNGSISPNMVEYIIEATH